MGEAQASAGNARVSRSLTPVRAAALRVDLKRWELFLNLHPNVPPTVAAILVQTDQQRRAFQVVDAVDDLDSQLGAYRAVEQLVMSDKATGDDGMPQLRRSDLAKLLSVLNNNLADYSAKAREAALFSAKEAS
jgi:hypothetical protein